jgi:hypothetical protein
MSPSAIRAAAVAQRRRERALVVYQDRLELVRAAHQRVMEQAETARSAGQQAYQAKTSLLERAAVAELLSPARLQIERERNGARWNQVLLRYHATLNRAEQERQGATDAAWDQFALATGRGSGAAPGQQT